MKVPPESPGTPEVVEVNASGQISLVWDPPRLLCSNQIIPQSLSQFLERFEQKG